MKKHSSWLRTDLHIHSKKSNEVKPNDYDGTEYDARKLLEILSSAENKVSIFSITDHNCINDNLYKELEEMVNSDEFKDKINYIIGVEVDVKDDTIIPDKVFHCLCFFDEKNIDLIKNIVDEIFNFKPLKERNIEENYPDIQRIFNIFKKNKIEDILLIPHFNNKSKEIPQEIAIENLNYLCFNGYEDANNAVNISKSLKAYLKAGCDNFPFAVFSDSHNIDTYPNDKENKPCYSCYTLSNLIEPFNSVKTAFQEPRLRISIDNVEGMRKTEYSDKYIKELNLNGVKLELSPYQNTIIGRFGSGKSLLLEKIKFGNSNLKNHEKYGDLYSENDDFKLNINGQLLNSVKEALSSRINLKKYEFLQQEKYFYMNYLPLNEAKDLFDRLNISFNFVEDKNFNFNELELVNSFNSFNTTYTKVGINNLNYEKAFSNEEYYSINSDDNYDEEEYTNVINTLSETIENIQDLKSLSISELLIFNKDELTQIDNVEHLMNIKKDKIEFIKNSGLFEKIDNNIEDYILNYVDNTSKEQKNTFDSDVKNFLDNLKKFNSKCIDFEKVYNSDINEATKQKKIYPIEGKYKISAEYSGDDIDYKSCIESLVLKDFRKDTLLKSIISTLYKNNSVFLQKKTPNDFKEEIKKYCDNVNKKFTKENVKYDILYDNSSLLKKSAGEKSSLFIKLIFDLMENDIEKGMRVLLILDQPESNIDNDNIFKEITNKLKEFKIKYSNFQSIIVTHNGNVGIGADSENIIIAEEDTMVNNIKSFKYSSGCIENKEYVKEVCGILEGGKEAMAQRAIKYGINIIKKIEEGGESNEV